MHLPYGVGGATETGIIQPDAMFNPVENALADSTVFYAFNGDLVNGFVHCQLVLPRGNNKVGFLQDTVFINFIFVKEGTARRLTHTPAWLRILVFAPRRVQPRKGARFYRPRCG